jgi:hypothetical protein
VTEDEVGAEPVPMMKNPRLQAAADAVCAVVVNDWSPVSGEPLHVLDVISAEELERILEAAFAAFEADRP